MGKVTKLYYIKLILCKDTVNRRDFIYIKSDNCLCFQKIHNALILGKTFSLFNPGVVFVLGGGLINLYLLKNLTLKF